MSVVNRWASVLAVADGVIALDRKRNRYSESS
jgi:hypothetical protein